MTDAIDLTRRNPHRMHFVVVAHVILQPRTVVAIGGAHGGTPFLVNGKAGSLDAVTERC